MKIRKLQEKDIRDVYEILKRNFEGIMSEYHSKEITEKFKSENNPDSIIRQMQWKEIFVVEKDGEIVATGALANFGSTESPKYSLSNFYIKPEYHQKGIGKWLFQQLFNLAKTKNVDKLYVPSSRNAIGFYEKMGFSKNHVQEDEKDEITWMTMNI